MRHTTGRAIGALIATSLALGLLAAPASAVVDPSTVYVAPGPVSAALTGGSCDSPDYVAIQDAVSSVVPGSTILVCPGTYREQVTVTTPGLTIKGTEPWKAVLKPPVSTTAGARPAGGFDLLAIIGADGVTVQWLKLVAPTRPGCFAVQSMILVSGGATDAVIRGNRVIAKGSGAQDGPCGYYRGIVVETGSSAFVGYNLVQDFRLFGSGILVNVAGTDATVVRNSVRYRHAGVAVGNEASTGIGVYNGATGRVERNAIVGLDSAGTSTPRLAVGIQLSLAGAGTVVRENLVRFAASGATVVDTPDARVVRNVLRDGRYGLAVGSGSSGNLFKGNTALGNSTYDCNDVSSGAGTGGTANTWTNNTGATSSPAGICTAS